MFRKSWWVDVTFNGRRYRKKSPENSRAGAVAYEAVLRQRLARGAPITAPIDKAQQDVTFEQFAAKWFDEYVVPNNKYSEQRTKRTVLRSSLVPFFGRMRIAQITARDIERYKAKALDEGVSRKTINNRLMIFNKCVWTAYEWLALPGSPPAIRWLKYVPTVADYLSPDECSLLLSCAEGTVHEMLLTALRTGMRQGELKGLQWSSIDWQSGSITVQHSRCDYTGELLSPKNNRPRHIPMDADLQEILLKRRQDTGYVFVDVDGRPFDGKRLQRRLDAISKKAGLRKIGWHTLRHTFASHLVLRGVPITAVQMLLGHASISTTMRYAHLAPATLRTAIDMLNPKTMHSYGLRQPVGNAWLEAQREQPNRKPESQNDQELRFKMAA